MVLLLFEQIVQLFLCVILGWFLVRLRLLKPTDSRVLSVVCLYLVIPCVIIGPGTLAVAHMPNEYVEFSQLETACQVDEAVIRALLNS